MDGTIGFMDNLTFGCLDERIVECMDEGLNGLMDGCIYWNRRPINVQQGEDGGDDEEDYIDSDDEREEGEKTPHENAFVYIDETGKLVYVDPEPDEADDCGEEKEEMKTGDTEKSHSASHQAVSAASQPSSLFEEKDNDGDGDSGDGGGGRGCEKTETIVNTADVQGEVPLGEVSVEAEKEAGDIEEASPCPLPRINPCLTVRANTLYVYGGLLEVKTQFCTHMYIPRALYTYVLLIHFPKDSSRDLRLY